MGMPSVTAGLLVGAGAGPAETEMMQHQPAHASVRHGHTGQQHHQTQAAGQFVRGEKTSSSVRLRKRRDDLSQPGRKINRHSGDFSYFSPRKEEIIVRASNPNCQRAVIDPSESVTSEAGNNWNYITFPNVGADPGSSHAHCAPVLVKMREQPAPGVNQVKLRSNLHSNRAVSASVMNIQESNQYQPAFRKSGDFSLFDPSPANYKGPVQHQIEDVRRRPHTRSHSQQPIRSSSNGAGPAGPEALNPSSNYVQLTPGRQAAPAPHGKPKKVDNQVAAKRCSGEFEFKRMNRKSGDFHQLSHVLAHELDKAEEQSFVERMISRELYGDSVSEGSEESGIFSTGSSHESPRKEARRPGLGRRAITQVNLRSEKKNSYNNALAKSQENLVKVCVIWCYFCRPYHSFPSELFAV